MGIQLNHQLNRQSFAPLPQDKAGLTAPLAELNVQFSAKDPKDTVETTKKKAKDKLAKYYPPKHNKLVGAALNTGLSAFAKAVRFNVAVEEEDLNALREKIDGPDGVMITPNHAHLLDVATVSLAFNKNGVNPNIMAAEELFHMMFGRAGWLLNRYGASPVPRGSRDKSKINAVATGTLEEGKRPFMMLPEGLVSNSNMKLNELKNGAANYAAQVVTDKLDHNVWIFPTAMYYDYENKHKLAERIEKTLDHLEEDLAANNEHALVAYEPSGSSKPNERLLHLIDYMGRSREASYAERYGFEISETDNPYERLANIRENLLDALYDKYGQERDPRANQDIQAKRLMAAIKSDFSEAKPKGLKRVATKLFRTATLPVRVFRKQTKADWVKDVKALKDVTYLTMYPEGYLDPKNISVTEPMKHVMINRMIEQTTILTRELQGKYTPLFRNKKFFRTPAIISQAWAWRQGDIQAKVTIGDPINVREFLETYQTEHPNFDFTDKAQKNTMLTQLTAKITEQLNADLKAMEQEINSEDETDRRSLLTQLD